MSHHLSGEGDAQLRLRRAQGYETARPDVQALVPPTAARILELGCSNGALGVALRQRNGAFVLGVEIDAHYAHEAASRLDQVVNADVETFLLDHEPVAPPFDCLVAADVLEHLRDPWGSLERALRWLAPGASVVVSVPNVLHWHGLWRLFTRLRWPRDDAGVFDRTHLRWFTRRDTVELLEGAGLTVSTVRGNYPGRGWRRGLSRAIAITPLRHLLAVQWVALATRP